MLQSFHREIKQLIFKYLKDNAEYLRDAYLGFDTVEEYLSYYGVENENEYGASPEIIVFATLANTPVYVLTRQRTWKWNPHYPLVTPDNHPVDDGKHVGEAIYLTLHHDHFEVVKFQRQVIEC